MKINTNETLLKPLKWYLVIVIFLLFDIVAQQGKAQQNVYNLNPSDTAFKFIDSSKINSGILLDRTYVWEDPAHYSGTPESKVINYRIWKQLYAQMHLASLPNQSFLTPIDSLRKVVRNKLIVNSEAIPIGLMHLQYDRIKDSLESDTSALLLYDTLLNCYFHNPNTTENPFKTHKLIAAAALTERAISPGNALYIDPEFVFTNSSTLLPLAFSIDLGDGLGYRNVGLGELITVSYQVSGIYSVTLKVIYADGYTGQSSFSLRVVDCSSVIAPDAMLPIKGKIPFSAGSTSSVAAGYAYIRYGNPNKELRKPVIIVEGIDFGANRNDFRYVNFAGQIIPDPTDNGSFRQGDFGWCQLWGADLDPDEGYPELERMPILLNQLLADGYDIIMLDFLNGADYLQKNAFLLVELINLVNERKVGKEENIVIGASMGGLVSRYALAYMEKNKQTAGAHCTKLYVSFDSPHEGANIPVAMQDYLEFLATKKGDAGKQSAKETKENKLFRPATQQMLIQHYSDVSYIRNQWVADLDGVGYPQELRKVAAINGSEIGVDQGYSNGYDYINWNYDFNICLGVNVISVNSYAGSGASSNKILYSKLPRNGAASLAPCVVGGAVVLVGTLLAGGGYGSLITGPAACAACISARIGGYDEHSSYYDSRIKINELDYAPGGQRNTALEIVKETKENPSFKGTINSDPKAHAFIPATSALGIKTSNVLMNISTSLDNSQVSTPFNDYYAPQTNEPHVFVSGDLNSECIGFIYEEIKNAPNVGIDLSITSGEYNFGNNNTDKTPDQITSLLINSNTAVYVNANKSLGLNGTTGNPPPANGTIFSVATKFGCSSSNITLEPYSLLQVGDIDNPSMFKGSLTVNKGGTLLLKSNSKLIVNQHSAAAIAPGAILRVQNGAIIEVKASAPLYLDGVLECEGSTGTLYVRGGGTIYVKENIIIPSGWKIQLEGAGTEIYVGNGATMDFANGAAFTLAHSSSRLKFISNSNLNIAANAEFTFDGDGYILWGTNNPITGGTGSSFKLLKSGNQSLGLEVAQDVKMNFSRNVRFIINDAKVLLRDNAGIVVNSRFASSRSLIQGSYTSLGIELKSTFRNIMSTDFIEGKYGLILRDPDIGLTLGFNKITGCTFELVDEAICADITSFNIDKSQFSDCGIGVNAPYIIRNSTISSSHFDNCSQAVVFGSQFNLSFKNNLVEGCNLGLDAYGVGTSKLECSEIKTSFIGIRSNEFNAIDMSNGSTNTLSNQRYSVTFKKSQIPRIAAGTNTFECNTHSGYVFHGTLADYNDYTNSTLDAIGNIYDKVFLSLDQPVNAELNQWLKANTSNYQPKAYSGTSTRPESYVDGTSDYRMYWGGFPTSSKARKQVYLFTDPTSGYGTCQTVNPCLPTVVGSPAGLPCNLDNIMLNCASCDQINTANYKFVPLNYAVAQNMYLLQTTQNSNDTLKALSMLEEIMRAKLIKVDAMDIEVLRRAYETYRTALDDYLTSHKDDVNNTTLLDNLIATSRYLMSTPKYKVLDPVMLGIDVAVAKYKQANIVAAITELGTLKSTYPSSDLTKYILAWECAFERVLNNTPEVSCGSFIGDVSMYNFNAMRLAIIEDEPVAKQGSSVKVFPNPIGEQTDLSLELNLSADDNLDIKLYDVAGKLIISQKLDNVKASSQTIKLNVGSLAKGVYTLSIDGQTIHHKEKVMVIR